MGSFYSGPQGTVSTAVSAALLATILAASLALALGGYNTFTNSNIFNGTHTTIKNLELTKGQLNYSGHIQKLQNASGTLCLINQTGTCGTSSASGAAPKVTINGNNRTTFTGIVSNMTFPAPKVSINGNNRTTFTNIIANMTFPAPKIVINGNNRSSFSGVANTTSTNTINGHSVSFPSSNSGTIQLTNNTFAGTLGALLSNTFSYLGHIYTLPSNSGTIQLTNGSLSSLTGTLSSSIGVTSLSNNGHISTFPSNSGTLLQLNGSAASLTNFPTMSSVTINGHTSNAPSNSGTILDTNGTFIGTLGALAANTFSYLGHTLTIPSNTGTLLTTNGSLSSLTGTLGSSLGVTTLSNSGHVSTFPSNTGTIVQQNGTFGGTISASTAATTFSKSGHISTLPSNTGTLIQTNSSANTLMGHPSDPTGTTTNKMMGMGSTCKLTTSNPSSGSVYLQFIYLGEEGTVSTTVTDQLRYGTGTAPTNGATVTGTQLGTDKQYQFLSTLAFNTQTIGGIITGLSSNTAYWFDMNLSPSGGTASIKNVDCFAYELP